MLLFENGFCHVLTKDSDPPVPPIGRTVFSDDFESGLSKWTEEGELDWRTGEFDEEGVPGSPAGNRVAEADNCDSECRLVMQNAVDLTAYDSAELSFYRYVDSSLDSGEYLKVDLYDGTRWNTVFDWQGGADDDSTWHMETHGLSAYADVDDFKVRFVAKASSASEDLGIDDVTVTGYTTSNDPPSISAIPQQSVDEGSTRSVDISATDPDGDAITLSAPGLPSFATFSDGGGGRGTVTLSPGYDDSGTYTIRITASDGTASDSESLAVTVNNVNRAPSASPIRPQSVDEGETRSVGIRATDPDGDAITLSAPGLPSFATFSDRGGGNGLVTFSPGSGDSGTYTITIHVSDGTASDSESFALTVRRDDGGPPTPTPDTTVPVITAPSDITAEATRLRHGDHDRPCRSEPSDHKRRTDLVPAGRHGNHVDGDRLLGQLGQCLPDGDGPGHDAACDPAPDGHRGDRAPRRHRDGLLCGAGGDRPRGP